jgi:hypothetical protein
MHCIAFHASICNAVGWRVYRHVGFQVRLRYSTVILEIIPDIKSASLKIFFFTGIDLKCYRYVASVFDVLYLLLQVCIPSLLFLIFFCAGYINSPTTPRSEETNYPPAYSHLTPFFLSVPRASVPGLSFHPSPRKKGDQPLPSVSRQPVYI